MYRKRKKKEKKKEILSRGIEILICSLKKEGGNLTVHSLRVTSL